MSTANASAGGDIDSIVASGGVGDKIKGVPDNRRALFMLVGHRVPDAGLAVSAVSRR